MNTSIRKTCEDVFQRIGSHPCESSMAGVETLIQTLETRAEHLDPFDRVALANLAAEYVCSWTEAEIFEAAAREQGYFTPSGRPNPTVSRAATTRARMRPIMAAIQKLLRSAPPTQGEGEAEENAYGVGTREAGTAKTTDTTEHYSEVAQIAYSEGEVPADVSSETLAKGKPPQLANDDSEPTAPPMNRAQRRAQARVERKQQRKAEKRLRHQQRKRQQEPRPAPLSSV